MATLVGESVCALVWEDCPRSEAVQLVRKALDAAKSGQARPGGSPAELTLHRAGLATVEVLPRNFQPHQLIDAAQRCLGACELFGGRYAQEHRLLIALAILGLFGADGTRPRPWMLLRTCEP